jgi:beta-mannanase
MLVPHSADARSAKPVRQYGKILRSTHKAPKSSRVFASAAARRKKGRKPAAAKTPSTTPATTNNVPLFGAHVDGDVYGGNLAKTDALEQTLGRRISISHWYQNWGGGDWIRAVHPELIKAVADSGRTPLLTWEPWNPDDFGKDQPDFGLRRIASGAYDDYITQWADGLKATGTTVYLRTMHEMNGGWYPWGTGVNGNDATQYKAAWRHIVDVFRSRGADNVKFVWCPLVDSVPDKPGNQLEDYYPGKSYVDVLSLDGYNWGTNQPANGGWRSFKQVFGDAYNRLTKLGPQPIWIAEVGSAAQGGDKAGWVRDMWKTAARMPQLKAIVWFDVDKEEDWRAGADPTVAAAFKG